MNVVFATSELSPLAKTGGLADVAAALPRALRQRGVDVRVIVPYYREVHDTPHAARAVTPRFAVPVGDRTADVQLYETATPDGAVPVYLVEHAPSFDRDGLYQADDEDHPDNLERFTVFCRAVLEGVPRLGWPVHVLHANDWQTALLPTYLRTLYHDHPAWRGAASVLTIHNLAYQGRFPRAGLRTIGLSDEHWHPQRLEFYGHLNLLKGGLLDSDRLTTVSPTYAREIQTARCGAGLEGVLAERAAALTGILNGIDVETWNPSTDRFLPARYARQRLAGKRQCKRALQAAHGLPAAAGTPLIGIITRLAEQKGIDLALAALGALFAREDAQCVLLGTGDSRLRREAQALQQRYPERFWCAFRFDEALAHQIEAGADIFLMPSRYEPCGLNQLYSLRYGTVPVVRRTGGLADTVVDATPQALRRGTATGFVFDEATPAACGKAVRRALAVYRDAPATWQQLRRCGMRQNYSWARSAAAYHQVYRALRPQVAPARRSRGEGNVRVRAATRRRRAATWHRR